MLNKILPMTGVEPRTSGIESDRSTNWATTTSHSQKFCLVPNSYLSSTNTKFNFHNLFLSFTHKPSTTISNNPSFSLTHSFYIKRSIPFLLHKFNRTPRYVNIWTQNFLYKGSTNDLFSLVGSLWCVKRFNRHV